MFETKQNYLAFILMVYSTFIIPLLNRLMICCGIVTPVLLLDLLPI